MAYLFSTKQFCGTPRIIDPYMETVAFTFQEGLPSQEQESILAKICAWPSIKAVGRVHPNSQDQLLSRMCMAYLFDETALDVVRKSLSSIPQLTHVGVPARRTLVSKVAVR